MTMMRRFSLCWELLWQVGFIINVLAYLGRLGTYLPDIQHKRICIKTLQPRKLTTSVDFLHSDFPIITSFFNSQSTQIIFVFYLKQALKQAPSLVGKEKTSRILEKNRRKTEHWAYVFAQKIPSVLKKTIYYVLNWFLNIGQLANKVFFSNTLGWEFIK